MKEKTGFVIVGSGWRAMYYARIAKALPEKFECLAMLCRSEEKKEKIRREYGIHAVLSKEECLALKPDFAVIAVDKAHISEVALAWAEDLPVLLETPAGTSKAELEQLRNLYLFGARIAVAEQYRCYAVHMAKKRLLEMGLLGEPYYLYLSEAHDYHAVSLMRQFLNLPCEMPFEVRAESWSFPSAETLTRYERFTDGRIADKKRTLAVFRFENGKVCVYDFDSEQYRSPIRGSFMKLQGSRGEMLGETVRWLDEANRPNTDTLQVHRRLVTTASTNPNLHEFHEISMIEWQGEVLYDLPFGPAGLSEDETALALMLEGMRDYARGEKEAPYPLKEALADAYAAICMHASLETGTPVRFELPGQ